MKIAFVEELNKWRELLKNRYSIITYRQTDKQPIQWDNKQA